MTGGQIPIPDDQLFLGRLAATDLNPITERLRPTHIGATVYWATIARANTAFATL